MENNIIANTKDKEKVLLTQLEGVKKKIENLLLQKENLEHKLKNVRNSIENLERKEQQSNTIALPEKEVS